MNAKRGMMLVECELSSSSLSSSHPPAIELVSPTSTDNLVISYFSNDSCSIVLPFSAKAQ
jgi:hypothetical protein